MGSEKKNRRHKVVTHLGEALKRYDADSSELNFLTVCKALENLMEQEWRDLKRSVEGEGLEANSPRSAFRQAAKLGLIEEPEAWLDALEARNNSVHDYFGITEKEYIDLARTVLGLALKKPLPDD